MKRIVSVLIVVCLLLGLCSCGGAPIEVKKFADETEMQEYLQGVWGNDDKTDLFFFDSGKLYLDENLGSRVEQSFTDSLEDTVKKEGYEAITKLAIKDHLANLEKEWLSYGKTCEFNPKKGTLTYQYDGSECVIYVGDGIIYDDYDCVEIEKISDTPSYACDELITPFEEAYNNFKPTTSMYRLTAEEYEEILKDLYPKAIISRDGSSVQLRQVTTDPYYTTTLEIEYDAAKGTLTATYTPHIRDYIYNLAHAAVLALGKAPNAPDSIELVEYFDTNKVSNNEQPDPDYPSWWIYRYEVVMPVDDIEIKVSSFSDINSTSWYKITIAPLTED